MRKLTAEAVAGVTGSVLIKNFDNPQRTPDFHHEMWSLCCSDSKYIAIAAPRGFSKSTAITVCYTLCEVMFRQSSFVLIVSATEANASGFLDLIKRECVENEDLIELFGIDEVEKDSYTDIIIRFKDGHKFRILAKGAEQKLRGLLWRGKRPDLVIGDDLEEDEQVLNKERREKFRSWFFNALLPCISDTGKVRIVGTILHLDALLERLLHKEDWLSARYKAHNEDFSELLWPERFPREKLEQIRRSYIEEGNLQGYSQEYLNWPIDQENAMFKRNQFQEMLPEHWNKNFNFYAAADFAISEKEKGDYTVFVVGATDEENYLYIVETVIGRFDSHEIIDWMIALQKKYNPEIFWVETEKIDKALGPFLHTEMMKQNAFINIVKKTPTKDKIQRAQSIAARMKAGGVFFNKNDDNYDTLEDNLLKVTRSGVRGGHDDVLDAFSWLGLGLAEQTEAPTSQELETEEWEAEYEDEFSDGIYACIGY